MARFPSPNVHWHTRESILQLCQGPFVYSHGVRACLLQLSGVCLLVPCISTFLASDAAGEQAGLEIWSRRKPHQPPTLPRGPRGKIMQETHPRDFVTFSFDSFTVWVRIGSQRFCNPLPLYPPPFLPPPPPPPTLPPPPPPPTRLG